MSIWLLLADMLDALMDKFDEITFFYGISGWDLIKISVILFDLAVIVLSIFQSDPVAPSGSGDAK